MGMDVFVIRESGLTITELELELLWLSHRPALSPVEVRVHHMTQISKKNKLTVLIWNTLTPLTISFRLTAVL